uniref:Major facilitator superfamily (MFS) profile domain-containing protein n=1 Tax=Haptolina brevifila TaxID=156173 RepID=A0A7S2NK59_9EUKA|mmetsp:Transcript_80499/g.159951  ORF Transcript_80499/g.159951 Transcript_80499/m.159951 type:complete len:140 (+) Transcript_80499:84-503(+)
MAAQSFISVVGASPSASLADRVGPANVIAPALCITASAMIAFPMADTLPEALAVLSVWAIGSTLLGSAPTAYATNVVPAPSRSQTLALMRTVGDLGLFLGASVVGGGATLYGSDVAMQGTATFLFASSGAFLVRRMAAR